MTSSYCRGACQSFFVDSNDTTLSPFEMEVYNSLPQIVKNTLIIKPYFIVGQEDVAPGIKMRYFDKVSFVYSCPGRVYILDARDTPLRENFVGDDIEYYPIRCLSDIPSLPLVGSKKEMVAIGAEKIFWGDGDLIAVFELLRRRTVMWNRIKDYDLIDIDTKHYSNADGDFCTVSINANREAFRITLRKDVSIKLIVSKESGFISVLSPGEAPVGGRIVYQG